MKCLRAPVAINLCTQQLSEGDIIKAAKDKLAAIAILIMPLLSQAYRLAIQDAFLQG